MKRITAFLITGLILVVFVGGYVAGSHQTFAPTRTLAADDCQMFTQTNHQACGAFLQYWQKHGGLMQQGYPISEPMSEVSDTDGQTYQVQYFERAVFEMHPEKAAPNNVLLSLLGSQKYKAKYSTTATGVPAPFVAATATATVEPAATAITATGTSTASTLPVSITSITSPVAHGASATLNVKTIPTAACSIDVEYASGKSTAAGLSDKTAAANGAVGWKWTVGARTTPGSWPVNITCRVSGMTGTVQATLQVT